MSRKSITATFFLLHAPFILLTTRCRESVVVLPGLLPKWEDGRWYHSAIYVISSATIAVRSFPIVLSRAMGWYTFGTS